MGVPPAVQQNLEGVCSLLQWVPEPRTKHHQIRACSLPRDAGSEGPQAVHPCDSVPIRASKPLLHVASATRPWVFPPSGGGHRLPMCIPARQPPEVWDVQRFAGYTFTKV